MAMTGVDPNTFGIAPSPQDLLDEAKVGGYLSESVVLGSAVQGSAGGSEAPQESPAEIGDDTLVEFTAAAQKRVDHEREYGVPDSIITVQQDVATLVGAMGAQATTAMAATAQIDPNAALALTQF